MEIKEVEDALTKGLEPVSKKLGEIEGRVSAIEKLPLEKAVHINTISADYKGRKLSKMGTSLRNFGAKDVASFGVFSNDEKADNFSKFMIDFVTKTTIAETTTTGSYLVPDEYQWDIVALAKAKSYALQLAKVINMSTDSLYIPVELTRPAVAWKGEGITLAQDDATFNQVHLTAKKLTAYTALTNELLEDSAIDVVSLITEQMAYGMGMELDNQMINGTGDPLSGLGTAACGYSVIGGVSTSMSTITADDYSLMISKLHSGDLANAKFLLGRLGLHYVRTLKDENSNPIFASPSGNVAGSIYQFPYFLTEDIANTDGTNKLVAILGDYSKFIIGRRSGAMVLESDPYTRFIFGETNYRMISRWALAIARATAFCRLMSPAS